MRVARFLVDLSGIESNAGPDSYVRAQDLTMYGACANHCSGEQAERHLVSLYHKAGTLLALQARPTHHLWGFPLREWFVSPEIPPWSAVPCVGRVDRFVHATADLSTCVRTRPWVFRTTLPYIGTRVLGHRVTW